MKLKKHPGNSDRFKKKGIEKFPITAVKLSAVLQGQLFFVYNRLITIENIKPKYMRREMFLWNSLYWES